MYYTVGMRWNGRKRGDTKDEVWNIIQRVLLDTSKTVSLEEYAETVGMPAVTLNRKS